MLFRSVGAHKTENPVRLIGIRGPDLLTIHQPVIALVFTFGLKTSKVRSRARL